jgi:uncharacterized membrane protein
MNTHNKSSLVLMEMIIAILFFALSAAVCAEIFLRSNQIDQDSTDLIHATDLSRNIAEVYKNGTLKSHYPYDSSNNLYYDSSWNRTVKASTYTVHLAFKTNSMTIKVSDQNDSIYSLTVTKYHQQTRK